MTQESVDIAILTVIRDELHAARRVLGIPDARPSDGTDGTMYYHGKLWSQRLERNYCFVLACVGETGTIQATAATMAVINEYRPEVVILVGIAAGLRDKVKIGNVVLSERVVAYDKRAVERQEGGTVKTDREPEIERLTHRIQQDVVHYEYDERRLKALFTKVGGRFPRTPPDKTAEYRQYVADTIQVQNGTLASGNTLWRDPKGFAKLREIHRKIEAAEMEAAGVVDACRRAGMPWLIIRGISDFGDTFKDDRFHTFASYAAATVLRDFINYGLRINGRPTHDVSGRCPYPGLLPFTYAQHTDYGGRDELAAQVAEDLVTDGLPLYFITGVSGSGKSSFARAGLLPRLEQALKKKHGDGCQVRVLDQWRPGRFPLTELLRQLHKQWAFPSDDGRLRAGDAPPQTLIDYLRDHTAAQQHNLIVLDQFEELLAPLDTSLSAEEQAEQQREREWVLQFLRTLKDCKASVWGTRIIATLRVDHLPSLYRYADLYELATRTATLPLRGMDADALEAAITKPLDQFNREQGRWFAFEKALLQTLVRDAARDPAYLPLLQVVLTDLWEQKSLRYQAYHGLADAIKRRAEAVCTHTVDNYGGKVGRPVDDREAILAIFVDLVEVSLSGDEQRDVRRRRSKAELLAADPRRAQLIEELVRERLLSISHEQRGHGTVEVVDIIHESLIANWEDLRQAIKDQRLTLQQRARFEQLLRDWMDHKRADAYLLSGARLAEAEELTRQDDVVFRSSEAWAFLQASIEGRKAVEQRQLAQAEALAEEQRRRAEAEQQRAEAAQKLAEEQQQRAETEQQRAEAAQKLAEEQQQRAEAEQRERQAAQQARYEAEERVKTEKSTSKRLRQRNLWLGIAAAAAIIAAMAAGFFGFQSAQRLEVSESARLAAASQSQRDAPETSLLLAYEAVKRHRNQDTEQALRDALARISWRPTVLQVPGTGPETRLNGGVFSPDGQRVVTASADGTARLWDLQGALLATLTGHTGVVSSAAFSPDGQQIATASADGTARVWDITGQPLATLKGHDDQVNSVAFSPDGMWVVTAGDDATARVWNWRADGAPATVLKGHAGRVVQASFSPSGDQIVTASFDNTAGLWSRDGALLAPLAHDCEAEAQCAVQSAAFSPDGKQIVTAGEDYTARVWNLDGSQVAILEGHIDLVRSAAFSPDGQRIVTASEDGTARIWDGAGNLLAILRGHTSPVLDAVFDKDGQRIVTASRDGTARVWSANDGAPLAILQGHTAEVVRATFSADEQSILTAAQDGTARIWQMDGTALPTLRADNQVLSAAYSPQGDMIAVARLDGIAQLWDAGGTLRATLEGHSEDVNSVAFSPDGQRIVTASFDNTARVWDLEGNTLATLEGHDSDVERAAFNPAGDRIVTAGDDGTLRLWSVNGTLLKIIAAHGEWVLNAAFSPDGQRIVSGSRDNTAKVWDLQGKLLATVKAADWVNDAAFSPDGKWLVLALGDQTAQVWPADGSGTAPRLTLTGHSDLVSSAAFSPDGQRILTASYDRTARVWDAQNGSLLFTQPAPARLYTAVFSPDGQRVLVAVEDGTARQFPVATDDMLAAAACQVGRGLTEPEQATFGVNAPQFVFAARRC